jgi:hypothetical protein
MDEIINRVAGSGIVTIDLETLVVPGERVVFDIAPHLHMGQILREKDFREFIKAHDWQSYSGKVVGVTCTAEAIVPAWAYMLVALALQPFAVRVLFATGEQLESILFEERLSALDLEQYRDARVVIKGCSDSHVPVSAYVTLAARLRPVARTIMFGEPCSTVPLYKKTKGG